MANGSMVLYFGWCVMGLSNILFIPGIGAKFDADAQAYITAVESADTQALEPAVRTAINAFVVGCKADGIWDAIKACCILAGARTLDGALVPLKGAAPTNINFVSGDYSRTVGLTGAGTNKSVNTNRNNNTDPQDSRHLAVFVTTTTANTMTYIGGTATGGSSWISKDATSLFVRASSASSSIVTQPEAAGFIGISRSNGTQITYRRGAESVTVSQSSSSPSNVDLFFMARNDGQHVNGSQAFYSIGESLNLALLDARVTTLINTFGAVI
jgi:hypothetical protein